MENLSPIIENKTTPKDVFSKQLLPYLALVSGILALSLSALFVRWAQAPGTVTSFYRMLVAAIVLFPLLLRQNNNLKSNLKKWWLFPVLGGLFTAIDHATWSTSISYTYVGNATLFNNLAPLWVSLIALVVWHEKLTRKFWLGLVFTLSGAVIVLAANLIFQPQFSRGDGLAIFSSLFYAGYFLITQRGRQYFDTLSYVWVVAVVSAVLLLGINLLSKQPLTGYPTSTYLAFLGAGLISQVIGYFSVGYALGHLPASIVSPTMITQPVITALMAIPLAGEILLPIQWLGGLIVLFGIYLINRSYNQTVKKAQALNKY